MKDSFFKLMLIVFLLGMGGPACYLTPQELPEPGYAGAVLLSQAATGPYTMTERSDWSRYDNGKYLGHVYREVRASITPEPVPGTGAQAYRGNFFVLEETLRDMRQSARAVDEVIPAGFLIYPDGRTAIEDDRGFPSLRGFPSVPREKIKPGVRWTAPGSQALDPLNRGELTTVPFVAEYQYKGIEDYKGNLVYRISAAYALRWGGSSSGRPSRAGAGALQAGLGQGNWKLQGSHTADILLRVEDGIPILIRINLDETYTWPDNSMVRFRGFTLIFGQGSVPINIEPVITALREPVAAPVVTPKPAPAPQPAKAPTLPELPAAQGIDVEKVTGGVRLTVKDIHFAPDSDEFLPEEKERLDRIAAALKQVPDRTFLVEGHTAAVGLAQGEMNLSVMRAKRMVDELVSRGIRADRFIYKGWGGTKPIAGNGDAQGRAQNRRVEITILE